MSKSLTFGNTEYLLNPKLDTKYIVYSLVDPITNESIKNNTKSYGYYWSYING